MHVCLCNRTQQILFCSYSFLLRSKLPPPPPSFRRSTLMKFLHLHHRGFATKYTGRIVRSDPTGRAVSVEVTPPSLALDPRGHSLPRRDLICRISRILNPRNRTGPGNPNLSDPLLDLSDYLQTLSLTLTPSEASEILKSLRSPQQALDFFKFCSSLPKFKHDCFTYNRLISILAKSDEVEAIKRVVVEMERDGFRGNISTVNILIGVGGAGDVEKCLELAKKWELRLNGYTYKCLLQAHLRCRDVERAGRVYEEMRRRGYKLDIFAYNMLLDALAKANKVDEAYKILADMKRKYCEPDAYTYTILIRMSGKMGKTDEFLSFFEEMMKKGHSPNLIAYNTIIEALAKNKMVDKAIFLFSKMVDSNCRPNEFTYSVLLEVLAAEGQLDRLNEIVEISNKHVTKSIYAYLIKSLSKLGHVSEAHSLFCKMWRYHDGDRDSYLSMLEILCDAGKTTEALDLLNQIHEKGISTDTVMYNMVFSALGKLKQIPYIFNLYEQMKQSGLSPDVFTFNILISSFGRAGLIDKATELFEAMENSDCKPDVITYNSLINCLGKNGDLDEAHMRFKEMQEKALNPDVITYSTLIECFGKSNKVEMACRLFDEMLSVGCFPNIVTYNILLDCLEKCGKVEKAFELYSTLKQQGLTPDTITYSVLERLENGSHRTVRARKQSCITGWIVSPLR